MTTTTLSPFARFWSLGYRRLTPIIPPDAAISARSTLHARVGTDQDGRGKTPGVRSTDGVWHSFDWSAYEPDEQDLRRWADMGAGVGIKTGLQADGTTLAAVDADTSSLEFARVIRDAVDDTLGRLPARVGNHPKALYLCRVRGALPYRRIEFGPDVGPQGKPRFERVEVLTDGRQFVAAGTHPKTGKPYSWPRELVAFDKLPVFEPEQVDALMERLRTALPAASRLIVEGAGSEVNQSALAGDLDTVRRAVAAVPNTSARFPSRETYLAMGFAIKAALPGNEDEALDIYQDWCARWQDGKNDPDVVAADWRRMKPPYRRGASWLYELAAEHGANVWFEALPESPIDLNPFEAQEAKAAREAETDVYPLLTVEEILSRPPPPYLVARHIPEVSVGFLYSVPGAGKSFLALDVALSIAAGGADWHGDAIAEAARGGTVLYIAAEGSFGFRNRIHAWMKARSSSNLSGRFLMIEQTIDFMTAGDVDKLLRTVRAAGVRPCLVVVDTVSRAMPGADENLQKEMTLFVRACDRVRDAFRCAVLGVHHAGKSGDLRGSSVLRGAGDFVFKLEREPGKTVGRLRCEKQKDGPDGWEESYTFGVVGLDGGESSLVVDRADLSVGPSVELTPAVAAAVQDAMREAWEAGRPWARAPQAGDRFGVRRLVQDFGFTAEAAETLLQVWEGTGAIAYAKADGKSKLSGYKVGAGPDEMSGGEDASGVFE